MTKTNSKKEFRRPQEGFDSFQIGRFFNAYDNEFIDLHMFIEPEIKTQAANHVELAVVTESDVSEINSLMDISAELAIEMACFNIKGEGKYHRKEKTNYTTESATIVHLWKSRVESIGNVSTLTQNTEAMKKAISDYDATHIISQITYGGRANLHFETELNEE